MITICCKSHAIYLIAVKILFLFLCNFLCSAMSIDFTRTFELKLSIIHNGHELKCYDITIKIKNFLNLYLICTVNCIYLKKNIVFFFFAHIISGFCTIEMSYILQCIENRGFCHTNIVLSKFNWVSHSLSFYRLNIKSSTSMHETLLGSCHVSW